MNRIVLFALFYFTMCTLQGQHLVSGTVFDKSKTNYVENVRVVSTGGMFAISDSMGKYSITVHNDDSITFYYNQKPTQKFPVHSISNPRQFDVSLHVSVPSKYNMLREVIVYSKPYKQDSLENRITYADVFNYNKPGLSTSITPGGGVGADVNELINIFRFRRNKNLRSFQQRLQAEEEEKYVSYRFNKIFVKRITGLTGAALDTFMVWYRPTYDFASQSSEIAFNQYIINAHYRFKNVMPLLFPGRKDDENN